MASKLFTAGQIGSLSLPNRLIRSATQDPFGHRDGTCDVVEPQHVWFTDGEEEACL